MSADATQILAAAQSAVGTVSPGVPVYTRKKTPAPTADPLSGFNPVEITPCWVLTIDGPDEVDRYGSQTHRSVDYTVTFAYVRKYDPHGLDDDPTVRTLKAAVRGQMGQVGLAGASQVWGAPDWTEGDPYRVGASGNTTMLVSLQSGTFHVMEPRL